MRFSGLSFNLKPFLLIVLLFFRVGSKENGTRFLTFVDAILGFKHLLTESDLDKALSMCSSLRGKLKSRFLVLSDDRIPPPPPTNTKRGKRGLDDQEEEDQSNKRNRFVNRSRSTQGVSGVSKIGSDQQGSKGQEASKEPPPRRSTPNRSAKRVPALPAVTDSQMDSLESNSTEDWASSKSHYDTIE